jgi:hypothetical protein
MISFAEETKTFGYRRFRVVFYFSSKKQKLKDLFLHETFIYLLYKLNFALYIKKKP